MTPEQFLEWQAYYTIEPFGDDWEQAAITACEVRTFMLILISGLAGESIREKNLPQPKDFVPKTPTTRQAEKSRSSRDIIDSDVFEAACRARFG